MLIPSVDLLNILHGAQMGVWTELLDDGSIALVVKLPQSIIKKMYRGIDCALITAVIEVERFHILYVGFCLYDDVKHPLIIVQPVATEKAQTEFQDMLRHSPTILHMFDELCHPLLRASCGFDSATATKAFNNIIDTHPHALGAITSDMNHALEFARAVDTGIDTFQKDLDSIKKGISSVSVPITNHVIPLSLIVDEPPNGYSINAMGDSVEFTITQQDEGYAFEQLLRFSMNDLYRGQAFLHPIVKVARKERELADLLALEYDDNIICLVQAKSIASLQVRIDQTSEKRSTFTERQVGKALKQLTGAIRQIRAGNQVLDCNHTIIETPDPKTSMIHAIVLVSELYPFADWKTIGKNFTAISDNEKYRALFHVLDLLELQQLVKSSNSAKVFHNYLLQRWVIVKKTGTAYVRSRTRRPQDNEADSL
jgi:hypothetical protein